MASVPQIETAPTAFECMAFDADMPSMLARFQVPEGFPLAGGIYRIERIRTATEEDKAKFAGRPDPVDAYELLDALRAVRAEHPCSCWHCLKADEVLAEQASS